MHYAYSTSYRRLFFHSRTDIHYNMRPNCIRKQMPTFIANSFRPDYRWVVVLSKDLCLTTWSSNRVMFWDGNVSNRHKKIELDLK